jgi:trk system potassium uptake protein
LADKRPVLVLGLGRFGHAIAATLEELGTEVIGVDASAELIERYKDELSYVRQADVGDAEVLQQLGAADCSAAVIAVGENLEASALAVSALSEMGVPKIWAKALSHPEAKVLERLGATRVILPEQEMGIRVARMLRAGLLEYVRVDDDHGLARLLAPSHLVGVSVADQAALERLGVRLVGISVGGEGPFTVATSDMVIGAGDMIAVYGPNQALDALTPD